MTEKSKKSRQGQKISPKLSCSILKEKIENPLKSVREIAKEKGTSKSTVAKEIAEVRTIRTKSKEKLVDLLFQNTIKASEIVRDRMNDEEYTLKANPYEVSRVGSEEFKRYQLLNDKPTDIIDVNTYDTEQQKRIAERILRDNGTEGERKTD